MNPPETVLVPEGWFWMGSENRYRWESPRHRVWVDAFLMARTTVKRSEYAQFLSETKHPEPAGWRDVRFSRPDQPVVGVSWFDGISYCEWLGKARGERYRLPTEAEWEKACRGGLEDAEYAWGDDPPDTFDYFSGRWDGPKPVGVFQPNGYALHNMGDNVHEWCLDWYAEDYYHHSPERNPTGPDSGTRRVSRGGSWRHQIKASRASHRSSLPPEFRYTDYGFRVIRVMSGSGVPLQGCNPK
ncbi:MAG: SUMF1/EgtB/PvdO family nonheme iron enzyme [Acidobacteria bacterium]|nr:SUMF1/EgtB/PvdO family nonheme iron enzyme [Acidobacteriota bacterium]